MRLYSSRPFILSGGSSLFPPLPLSLISNAMFSVDRYTDRVAPWVHYIPIQLDLSDLHDALLFFRGDANGEGAHEDMARKIAVAGREWSMTFWRKEDLTAYFFRCVCGVFLFLFLPLLLIYFCG
jgi:hypothetical protein